MDKIKNSRGDASIIGIKGLSQGADIGEFFRRFNESELSRDFLAYRLSLDALRESIRDHIVEHGMSSLFHGHITCDALTHPGFTFDQIEDIVIGVMAKLDGVEHLLIVDGYFYDEKPEALRLLEKIVRCLGSRLQRVTLITHGKRLAARPMMHRIFRSVAPSLRIDDVISEDFHDRYWIDVGRTKGVIVGTSLNGIGKKVAMIDHASFADTRDVIELAFGHLH